jgi:hypothetical protein
MFAYLFKTTCLVNNRVFWSIHRCNDLLFDVPRNQNIAWPSNRLFVDDYNQYGINAFHHQVIHAYPATDSLKYEKDLQNNIANTPPDLRYNLVPATQKGREKTPEELEKLRSWTYITNGKSTRRVKKDEKVPEGWILGNGNLMKATERADLRLRLRDERKNTTSSV